MFFPDEILTLIFLKLSLEGVKAASQTCKRWRKIISADDFKAEFYLSSKPSSLLVVYGKFPEGFKTMTIEFDPEEKLVLESFKLNPYSSMMIEKSYTALSVCNGLILANNDNGDLFVVNTATKHCLTLPKCPSQCRHQHCRTTLSFCPDIKAYKIVHVGNNLYTFEILTIGSSRNEWRVVPCSFCDSYCPNQSIGCPWSDTLTTDRQLSLHWRVFSLNVMLSMDVCSENFRSTLLPSNYNFFSDHILEIGDSLGIVQRATDTRFKVSVLRDPLAGNWEPLYSIEAEEIIASQSDSNPSPSFRNLRPIFSLRKGNVIIFIHVPTHWWYFYDAKLRKMKRVLRLETTSNVRLLLYKGSLFHWNNAKGDKLFINGNKCVE